MNVNESNLPKLWANAAQNNADTSSRIELYQETEKVISFLGRDINQMEPAEAEQITNICTALMQGFEQLNENESKQLVNWIAQNTGIAEGEKFEGAYPVLHHLFEAMAKVKNERAVDPAKIDSRSLEGINSLKSGMPESSKDIRIIQFSNSSSKDLLSIYQTSKESRAFIFPIFIDRINKGELLLRQLGIKEFSQIKPFFGDSCSSVHNLNLSGIHNLDNEDIAEIYKLFPNISNLCIHNAEITNESGSIFEKMKSLKSLELSSCRGIENIDFLKQLPNLTSLNLANCQFLKDITVLEHLRGLTSLNLRGHTMQDIKVLQNLTRLTNLDLSICVELADISTLENLTGLTNLNLSSCLELEDISTLKNLKELTSLNLNGCNSINDQDFQVLGQLGSLTNLNLSSCKKLSDITFLKNLTKIEKLNLSNYRYGSDFSILQEMKELSELLLNGCKVDVNYLQNIPSIRILNLSNCYSLDNVNQLQSLQKLENLDISHNNLISTLDDLKNLKKLEKLNIESCPNLVDISSLVSLNSLKELNIGWNFRHGFSIQPTLDVLQKKGVKILAK